MVLRNVSYKRIEDMTDKQRKELNITDTEGIVAVETHNPTFKQVAVPVKNGLVNYILNGN